MSNIIITFYFINITNKLRSEAQTEYQPSQIYEFLNIIDDLRLKFIQKTESKLNLQMQVTTNRNSQINRLKGDQSPSFSKQSYFTTSTSPAMVTTVRSPSPLDRIQTKKSQVVERTTTIKSPLQMVGGKPPIIYSETPMVSSQMLVGDHIIRTNSPGVSRVRISPPRASIVTGSSRVMIPAASVLPMTTTMSPVIMSPSSYSIQQPTVTHYETVKQTVSENTTEIQRLQAMNDFLTENYTLVYNKLRELEDEQARAPKDTRPPTETVNCINQSWLHKAIMGKIEQICDFEVESTLNKFRAINLNTRTFKSSSITARFN